MKASSMDNISESEFAQKLVDRILAGDHEAESAMVQRYHEGLFRMLLNRSKDAEIAESVAQECWLVVLTKVRKGDLNDHRKLAAFIVQTGKYQLLMKYRANKKRIDSGGIDPENTVVSHDTPERKLRSKQFGGLIFDVLSELKQPRDREIIRRFYVAGDDKHDLCKEFDLSAAHFDRVLYRARERFKQLWKASHGDLE